MKPIAIAIGLLIAGLGPSVPAGHASTNDLTSAIQRGLFEEEANQNLGAAIQAYQAVASKFDQDRKLAATAIFRLGECYRKQGNTNEAAAQYERVLREFSDQPTLVSLSRQNLGLLGSAPASAAAPITSDAARREQKRLLEDEIKLVQNQLEAARKQVQAGVMPSDALVSIERDLLKLRRQLAGLEAGEPTPMAAGDASVSAAASAQAEALSLENQLAVLTNLPPAQRRLAVRQNFVNPVLTSLIEQLAFAERSLANAEKEYGPEHTLVLKAKVQVQTINRQIDEQVEGVLQGLRAQAAAARRTADMLSARAGTSHAQASESAAGAASATTTATEAEEVKRIQAMIKDSPDLINSHAAKNQDTPLHTAAAQGQLTVAQFLLANGADVEAKSSSGRTPLHDAATSGHKSMVELLLDHHANVQTADDYGDTPLHVVAEHGYFSVAETLLARGAQVNAKDQWGATPLLCAVAAGSRPLAELLLARGADVNVSAATVPSLVRFGQCSGTALDVAVQRGDLPMVELLLSNKADIAVADASGDSPLALAAARGDLGIAEALLAKGADVNARGTQQVLRPSKNQLALGADVNARNTGKAHPGWTPLHWAVENNHKDMVALLLKHKADPNARMEGNYGEGGPSYTPLLMATARVFPDIVDVLLAGGADPNLGNGTRFPILNVMNNEDPPARVPMLKSLLDHGADIEVKDPSGNTPLWLAAARVDKDAMALLLAHKADPNTRNKTGNPCLCVLVEMARQRDVNPLIQMLLAAGADVNARQPNGNTALHIAAYNDFRDLAALLLANKADPNAKDREGMTPLHVAVFKNEKEMAKLLLVHNADPNERDEHGRTPLEMAKNIAQAGQQGVPAQSLGVPGQPFAASPTPGEPATKPEAMADLLRRHGALDDLPHMDQIGVRRTATGFSGSLFTRGAQDSNHFTLLDLVAAQYGFLSSRPKASPGPGYSSSAFAYTYSQPPFPDFKRLHISRPSSDLKGWHDQVVDLTPVLESGDCTKDVPLQWGDVVEIPEADHPLNEKWDGFSREEMINLRKCLTRKVEVLVKGQATPLTLSPQMTHLEDKDWEMSITAGIPFWLRPVLLQSRLVLISSDLSRVKVTRRDAATGQTREWVVDCSRQSDSGGDVWLEDGDRIEVPDKGYASGPAQLEEPQQTVPGLGPRPKYGPPRPSGDQPVPSRTLRVPAAPLSQAAVPPSYQGRADQFPQAATIDPATGLPVPLAETAEPNASEPSDTSDQPVPRGPQLWQRRATPELAGRAAPSVWTGTDMVVFGGEGMGRSFDDGARYSFAENSWASLPRKGAPSSRTGLAMVWSGKEVIVWGGFGGVWGNDTNHNDGARYNPRTDTWKPMSTRNAPEARFDCPAVWTGREMLVWGGYTDSHSRYQGAHADAHLNTGGRYDPASDSWKPITTRGAPSKRYADTMVWTGKEMLVWGGANTSKALNDGGRYNPSRDSWKRISTEGAPSPRGGHVAVWTGKEMLVWGGSTREPTEASDYFENGGRYKPETDTWRPISTIGAPKGRVITTAVWTGTQLVVWGGVNDSNDGRGGGNGRFVGTGGIYNPATDAWTEIPQTSASPTASLPHYRVLRGSGKGPTGESQTQESSRSIRGNWAGTVQGAGPSARLTSGVWTGQGLLIFGGYDGTHLNDTWFYTPPKATPP